MDSGKIFKVKNRLWTRDGVKVLLLCPKNRCLTPMRKQPDNNGFSFLSLETEKAETYICPSCQYSELLADGFDIAKTDALSLLNANKYKEMSIVDIDGISTPIAKTKVKSKDSKYFVTAQLMESKRGLQLAVYAGEKGKEKSQIFVEPEIKRLAFDHTNTHPNEVFLELKATFDDGTSQSISKEKRDSK